LAATPPDADAPAEEKKKKPKKDKSPGVGVVTAAGRILVKGRVFALAELQHHEKLPGYPTSREEDSFDLSLPSARIGFEYEAPIRWISAEVEVELAGNPQLKDGYVQARGEHFFARAGQFKMPVSGLEMESPWVLPLARRGLVNVLLTDWLDVAGRRPGLIFGWRAKGGLKPRITLGAFQGESLGGLEAGDRDTDLLRESGFNSQNYVARIQAEPADIQLGAWYQHRVGAVSTTEDPEHYFTAGIDAATDRVLPGGGIRAWLQAEVGESWYEYEQKAVDDETATFISARALVAYRFGGTVDEEAYFEPFGFFGMMEPDTEITADWAWEGAIGVNAGYWRRARLTLQGEINRAQRNFPLGAARGGGYLHGEEIDRMGLLLQAGVAW
jgi:hypothetical protein